MRKDDAGKMCCANYKKKGIRKNDDSRKTFRRSCASTNETIASPFYQALTICTDYTSPHCDERPFNTLIDTLVFHYTDLPSIDATLDFLMDPACCVSAHYCIGEDGKIYQMVSPEKRAWHAGESCWQNKTHVNDRSIGIELQNKGRQHGYHRFPKPQIDSLIFLCHALQKHHTFSAQNIVGHSDIAPHRKHDPGEKFPWHTLALSGIGVWPEITAEIFSPGSDPIKSLGRFGYAVDRYPLAAIVNAFQMRFMPWNITGEIDQPTHARIQSVCGALE